MTGAGQVSRTIEVIARPNTLFPRGVTVAEAIKSNSDVSYIDSFDSGDPTKSTNGLYDPAKRQQNGTVGTLNSAGSDLNDIPIYGDLYYSGPAIPNTGGVTGNIITPFEETLEPVKAPNWTIFNGSYGDVKNDMILTSGPEGTPTRYIMTKLEYSSDTLTLEPPAPGQSGEIEIWVTGDLKLSGNSQVISKPGVRVTIFVEGDIDAGGNSFANESNRAENLSILGVSDPGADRQIKLSGNADFTATIYAPDHDIKFVGNGAYTGAFVGRKLEINGNNAAIHYDEALTRIGRGKQYEVASWIEDIR